MAEYHVENFGCRASQADGEAIAAGLRLRGLTPAPSPARADVIIVNTCTVTANADRTARAYLRRVHRENPAVRILVTGCYAQRAPQELADLPGVHAVVGNSHKALVPQLALEAAAFVPVAAIRTASAALHRDDAFAHAELAMPPGSWAAGVGPTRPNLKVQDGCGNRCSFCIIPATRGFSRSLPLEACLAQVNAFTDSGVTELVLSGINLGRWGKDLTPRRSLEDLVGAILSHTGLPRLRLSSIEPMDWTAELLDLFRAQPGRLARHAHLPLQSGSDAILRAMHRRYRPWHYAEKLRQIRAALPDAGIGADVMVGFPGETDEHFAESCAFIAAQPFTYLHLFPFSPRPGTPAWRLARESSLPKPVISARMAHLSSLIEAKSRLFRQSFVGRDLPAVTLVCPQEGASKALSDNFLELRLDVQLPPNRSVQARITGCAGKELTARLVA